MKEGKISKKEFILIISSSLLAALFSNLIFQTERYFIHDAIATMTYLFIIIALAAGVIALAFFIINLIRIR